MFKNKAVKITLDRAGDEYDNTPRDARPIEEKTKAVLQVFEKVAIKMFVGACVYKALDTSFEAFLIKVAQTECPTEEAP